MYVLADTLDIDFDKKAPVYLDTETDGLYGAVRLLQLFQPETMSRPIIVDTAEYEDISSLKQNLNNLHIVCHNARYDFRCLGISPASFDDTLLLARHCFLDLENYSLDRVYNRCSRGDIYKDVNKKLMQSKGFSLTEKLTEEQYTYAAKDVIALSEVYPYVSNLYKDNRAYIVDKLSTRYALEYEKNGMSVDYHKVAELIEETDSKIEANESKLNGLNVNSPLQCKKALGTNSTDKATLMLLIGQGNELAKLIYEQRRLKKLLTLLHSYNYDKVYTVFNVAGAATGRFTASGKDIAQGINSQQIPRSLKHLFHSLSPDVVTIEADYSTLELRLAAAIFGDSNMARQLKSGLDLHTELAKMLTGKSEVSKEDRTRAKAGNFGFVYGMSAITFKEYAYTNYGLDLTIEEAEEMRSQYFKMYPDIASYHKNVWSKYKQPGYFSETALGRRVKPKLGTDAINCPVQGSGAECTKLAIYHLCEATNDEALKYIVNVVHDSIKLEVPAELAETYKNKLEVAMIMAWNDICQTDIFKFRDIPIKVDIECIRNNC